VRIEAPTFPSFSGPAASPNRDRTPGVVLDLPHLNAEHWARVCKSLQVMCEEDKIESSEHLLHYIQQYLPEESKWQNREITWQDFVTSKLGGLTGALTGNGGGEPCYQSFFKSTLKYIAKTAQELPQRMAKHGISSIHFVLPLQHGQGPSRYSIHREVCQSLMANLFLCTFDEEAALPRDMPMRSFLSLLCTAGQAQEHAKLRMFIHYFERCLTLPPDAAVGQLHIIRRRVDVDEQQWAASEALLLKVEVVPPMIGFEHQEFGRHCLHADFANKFLGGGVLSGGCVQEEIRFAICPELVLGALICPVMGKREAIQMVGAEQYRHTLQVQLYASTAVCPP
jgi:hypothetical protein